MPRFKRLRRDMLPVIWLETALDDLGTITEYIAERNPSAAIRLNARLQEDAELLGKLPVLFRRGPVEGSHQFVSHPNYILIYQVTPIAVEILNVVHSRQEYPKVRP